MLGSMSVCGPPAVASHLWLLIFSCSLHSQPALSDLVFSTRPEDSAGVLGAPLTLHCAVSDSSRQGALPVRWERASGEAAALSPGPDKGIHQVANGSLFFLQLREGDLGRYVCSAGIGDKHIRTVVQVMEAGLLAFSPLVHASAEAIQCIYISFSTQNIFVCDVCFRNEKSIDTFDPSFDTVCVELEAVFFSPQSQTVSEGQTVFLQCVSGNSSPPAHITWLKDNTLFTKGTQMQGQYGGGNQRKTSGTLHLSNVLIEDEGEYVCVTHNALVNSSLESKAATLTVQGVPTGLQITQGPDNLTIAMQTEVSMCCAARGFPAPTVQWFKDSHLLANSSCLSLQNKGQLLVFKNVSEEDEGSYHCEARNERETVRSQPAYLLPAEMEWNFVLQPTNQTVRMGDSVTLVCRPPYSRPPARVSWFKNNRLLTPKTHFTVGPNGDLIFHSAHDTDRGVYFCRASNIHLYRSVTSRTARLTVLAPPSVRLWPPVVMVPMGAQVVFHCQVWGHPLPSIVWSKQGRSMQTGGKISVGVRNATLYILSVRSYDEGTYTCAASNTVGHDRSTATLRVAVSPIIVSFVGAVSSSEGSSVVLPCRAVGDLPIRYTWTRGHSQTTITPTLKRHVDDEGALHISRVQLSDAGDYHCAAENRAGQQQRRSTLTISAEDDPADRDKQHRQIASAVPNTEAEQRIPLSSNVLSLAQRSEMTQLQAGSTVSFQASQRDLSNDITHVSAPDTLRRLSSLKKTALGLAGLSGGQTGLLVLPDQASAKPTQPTITQIQLPVQQPPHPPLYPPLDLLSQPSVTHRVASLTQLPIIHTQPTLAHNPPPETQRQVLVPHSQSQLTQSVSQSIHNQPSVMHIQHQVSDQPIKPLMPITIITQSLVPRPQPSPESPTHLSNPSTQSPECLAQPREPVTQSLLMQTLHPSDSITQTHHPVTQRYPSYSHLQHPSPVTLFSVTQIQPESTQNQSEPTQTQPEPTQTQPEPTQTQPEPTQTQPEPTQTQPEPTQTQPETTQTQPETTQTQPEPTQTQPEPTQTQPETTQTQPETTQTQPETTQTQPETTQTQPETTLTQPEPTQTQLEPTQTQPEPTQAQPEISQTQPQPTQTQPEPTQTQPKPTQTHPLPKTQPETTQTQPEPTQTQPEPTQAQPEPTQTQPEPTQAQPKPTQTQPEPTQAQPGHTQTQPEPTQTQPQPTHTQSEPTQTQPEPQRTQPTHLLTQPSVSITHAPDLSTTPPTPDPKGPSAPWTSTPDLLQQNMSQPAKPVHPAKPTRHNDTEPTEWLKRNTSQSPIRTSEDPRVKPPPPWLPVLKKHDIPIVVGVGVSLAFIFITMAFYSLVQKKEPAPAIRVPRNLGVPFRHAEHLATGRTYENRAFEDDDLVAVIEQSPDTSDTRTRPPAPSPVTVMIDPAFDETQETQARPPSSSEHSVIAETYSEAIEDTQVDPFLDEEKDCSLSHPSIQLQCVEDWGGGGVYGQCQGQDFLSEPPSLTPSPFRSLSPSPPPVREESLRSSLTLQTTEPCATPIHHSVRISHGNAPLLLSHCVSLGLTTVAVDVHFYPAALASATAAMATVTAATQVNATAAAAPGPQLSSRLAQGQEHDQSAPSMCQSK
uniref:neurofascin-like isoform X2 n=1 Tax=Oncorhynchus gorbuscha TaxID=8017 RepID=UPI001EAE8BE9|nr:neurofascin-like isoform X2 [Oncorhynchus gorbuscha]